MINVDVLGDINNMKYNMLMLTIYEVYIHIDMIKKCKFILFLFAYILQEGVETHLRGIYSKTYEQRKVILSILSLCLPFFESG